MYVTPVSQTSDSTARESVKGSENFILKGKMKVNVTQLSLTLRNPVYYTVHGVLQAGISECVAFSFSRVSSQPGDQSQVSLFLGAFFTI